LLDAQTGQELRSFQACPEKVTNVVFSPDGKRLATAGAGEGNFVRIWDHETGQLLHTLRMSMWPFHGLAFSPDSRLLALATGSTEVPLYDVGTGAEAARLKGHAAMAAVAFSPDGKRLVCGGADRLIQVWDP